MSQRYNGTTELARAVDALPVRSRVSIVLLAAILALRQLENSPHLSVARDACELIRKWHDGEWFQLDQFEDVVTRERPEGISLCLLDARSEKEKSAWLVLASAVLYTAFQAYHLAGRSASPLVDEVEEDELDDIDRPLRALSLAYPSMLARAAGALRRDPNLSFAQLQSVLLQA